MIKSKMTKKLLLYMFLLKRLLTRKQTKKTKQNQKHLKTATSTRNLAVKYSVGEQDSIALGGRIDFQQSSDVKS